MFNNKKTPEIIYKNNSRRSVVVPTDVDEDLSNSDGFQPEYVRLKKEPVVYPVNEREFIKHNKQQEIRTKAENPRINDSAQNSKIQNPIVYSGQNEDWISSVPEISFNEKEVTSPLEQEIYENGESLYEEESVGLNKMKINDCVLIYNNSAIEIASQDKIESTLYNIIKTENAEIEDFIVLRRLPVKVGILIG
jgi:hypothetical protein